MSSTGTATRQLQSVRRRGPATPRRCREQQKTRRPLSIRSPQNNPPPQTDRYLPVQLTRLPLLLDLCPSHEHLLKRSHAANFFPSQLQSSTPRPSPETALRLDDTPRAYNTTS